MNWLNIIFPGNAPTPPPATPWFGAQPSQVDDKPEGLRPVVRDFQDWPVGQQILNDFIVEAVLGQGGMGKVYRVRSCTAGTVFAVKRAIGLGPGDRRNFLRELHAWIDLPEHENLVKCRFFRSLGEEVLIFADYVPDGSLKDWIVTGKLYAGNEIAARIIDISIQAAWGLHCLHELQMIHQDVKPANVLLAMDEVQGGLRVLRPQVTDFGLARAVAGAGESRLAGDPQRSILVTSRGGTPAYWSPEQASGAGVKRQSDMWSWGLMVLEMFSGGVTWRSGDAAAAVLEEFLKKWPQQPIPQMPRSLGKLLRECFRLKPEDRPKSMLVVLDRMKAVYQEVLRIPYGKQLQPLQIPQRQPEENDSGTKSSDGVEWLGRALGAMGYDPSEAQARVPTSSTRQGRLASELTALDEAKMIFVKLVERDGDKHEENLIGVCSDKARVLSAAGDYQGAVTELDYAIPICEKLFRLRWSKKLSTRMASLYSFKALQLRALRNFPEAVLTFDKAIAINSVLAFAEGGNYSAYCLANNNQNRGLIVQQMGDYQGADPYFDKSVAIFEKLVIENGVQRYTKDLAIGYRNKANSLTWLRDHSSALALHEKGIAILENLPVDDELGHAFDGKGRVLNSLKDYAGALAAYDQAAGILERLVNQDAELSKYLARAYRNKGEMLHRLKEYTLALSFFDAALAILEPMVNLEGRKDLASWLASVYDEKSITLGSLGEVSDEESMCDRAIALYQPLASQFAGILVVLYERKAVMLKKKGKFKEAVELYDITIPYREQHNHKTSLIKSYRLLGDVLSELKDHEGAMYHFKKSEALIEVKNGEPFPYDMSLLLHARGVCLKDMGDFQGAIDLYDTILENNERTNIEQQTDFLPMQAVVYISQGLAFAKLGQAQAAYRCSNKVIEIRELLVREGKNFSALLADAFQRRATLCESLGDKDGTIAFYLKTISTWENFLGQKRLNSLELAKTYYSLAIVLAPLDRDQEAVEHYEKAIEIFENLVNKGRSKFVGELAKARGYQGNCIYKIGSRGWGMSASRQIAQGKDAMRSAQGILKAEAAKTGRKDLKTASDWLYNRLKSIERPSK